VTGQGSTKYDSYFLCHCLRANINHGTITNRMIILCGPSVHGVPVLILRVLALTLHCTFDLN